MTSLIKTGEIIKFNEGKVLITLISNKDYEGDRIYFYLKEDGEVGKITEEELEDTTFLSVAYSKEALKEFLSKVIGKFYNLDRIPLVEVSLVPWKHKQILLGNNKDCYLSTLGLSQYIEEMIPTKSKFEIVDESISLDEFLKDFRPFIEMI